MKVLASLLCASLALAACATSRPIQGPNGGIAYFIKCGSAVIDKCYEEAAKVCPKGYTFADSHTNQNGVIVPTGGGFLMTRGPSSMLVECKS